MLWIVMKVQGGEVVWGKGDGRPKQVEAKTIGELNAKIADEDVEPFEVCLLNDLQKFKPGEICQESPQAVYLLQSPPDVFLAVQMSKE
jgi:hypothetical protein